MPLSGAVNGHDGFGIPQNCLVTSATLRPYKVATAAILTLQTIILGKLQELMKEK
jgi:hypothetical protein